MTNTLLDHLRSLGKLKNDAALARTLHVAPPVISKLRHGTLPLGDTLIIRMHETLGMAVRDIKFMAGVAALPSAVQKQGEAA